MISGTSETHLLEKENENTYDYTNCDMVSDDKNEPGTSFLRSDLSPELKDNPQISDLVSDNDDDSVKDPNYESDSSSSTSSSSARSSDSSSLSTSDYSGNLSSSNNLGQAAETLASEPAVSDTRLADTQLANPQAADTQISSPKKRGGKRVAVAENWLSNKAKKLRNSGQAYTSRSKSQKRINARSIRPACGDKCRLKCSNKVDENTRREIFQKYWALEDINRQRDFIHKYMKPVKPAYRYSSADRPRQHNNAYYFPINDNE